jgi:tetratricopeptide (TPR) repeat protein
MEGLVQRESFPTEAFYLGLFHYWRGETERAASRFAEALGSSRGAYYEVYLNLGSALYRLGRFAEARDCYRVVLEEAPSNRLARQRLNDIERRFSVAK